MACGRELRNAQGSGQYFLVGAQPHQRFLCNLRRWACVAVVNRALSIAHPRPDIGQRGDRALWGVGLAGEIHSADDVKFLIAVIVV